MKTPEKVKNYIDAPGFFMFLLDPSAKSPAAAVVEADEVRHESERPRCPQAYDGVEVDTCSEKQDEAVGDAASTGAAPHQLRPPDPTFRPATSVAGRRRRQIRPSNNRNPHRQLRTKAKWRLQQAHLAEDVPPASDSQAQISQTPPSTLEQSAAGTKKGWRRTIPQQRRCLRLADAALESTPQRNNLSAKLRLAMNPWQANPSSTVEKRRQAKPTSSTAEKRRRADPTTRPSSSADGRRANPKPKRPRT
ncbi:unnamed protein product [Urochloa humidicola]